MNFTYLPLEVNLKFIGKKAHSDLNQKTTRTAIQCAKIRSALAKVKRLAATCVLPQKTARTARSRKMNVKAFQR